MDSPIISSMSYFIQKLLREEFPLWLSELRTQHCLCEGLIHGLAQWVKDLVLLQAVVQAYSCSCISTPSPGTSIWGRYRHKKKKKIQIRPRVFQPKRKDTYIQLKNTTHHTKNQENNINEKTISWHQHLSTHLSKTVKQPL